MSKADLINVVAAKTEIKKKDVELVVNAALDAIVEAMKAGDKVQLMGFGTFEVKQREERQGRNPATGETITIPASKHPTFTAGKALKDSVN